MNVGMFFEIVGTTPEGHCVETNKTLNMSCKRAFFFNYYLRSYSELYALKSVQIQL